MNFNILCSKFLHLYARWQHLRKLKSNLILAVKTTIFLIVIFCVQVSANGFSQTITFSGNNVPLTNVLSQIRKQSGWHLLYDSELLKKSKKVTVDFTAAPLSIVLEKIFADQPLGYEITGNTILIVDKAPLQLKSKPVNEVIKGIVKDQNGKPISLATVKIKGSNQSTTTDDAGGFVISVPQEGAILLISYVGFTTREVPAKQGMSIILTESLNNLDDMVVVGYGTTRRKDLTGSVSSIKVAEVKDVPFMSVDEALSGKASGVQVIKADGSPGGAVRIRVRGGASLLGTNDPLYVIDGIPVIVSNDFINSQSDIVNPIEAAGGGDGFNSSVSGSFNRGLNNLAGLNISDIESIDILKDASATAIYGSKAANGVVIITTKKGKQNSKPQLSANFYTGINKPITEKVLNASQYKTLLTESATNYIQELQRIGDPLASSAALQALTIINDPTFFSNGNTNWLDKILRNGHTQNADLSVSGGGVATRYYTSLNYTNQTGTIVGTDFKRLSGKINLDNEISSRFKLITNLNYSVTNTNITNGAYGQALTAPPTFDVFNADGTYSNFGYLNANYRGYQNPVALTTATNNGKDYSLMGFISGEYNILKDLQFKTTFSANYSNYIQKNYTPSYVEIGGFYGRENSGGGLGSNSNLNSLSTFIENTLTWNKTFNTANRLNILAGTSWENNRADMFSATGRGFPDDFVLNNLSSAVTPVTVRGASPITKSALLSFYLRANYVWKDRYLFTFTGRSDASSKFSPDNRVGYFPSGAVAWRISEESFLKDVSWIEEIKLRVGAGRTGTQSIGDNLWRTLYTPDSYAGTNAIVPSQLGNARIKWESTTQQDLGLDFNLFKGRFGGTIAYYKKNTDGALLNLTPAPSSAFTSVIYNIAKIQNKGIELELQGDFVRGKKFKWNGALNISRNISKVLNIEGGPFSDPADRNNITLGTSIVREGDPLGLLYGRVATGVIKTQEQLEAYKLAFPLYFIFQPTLNIGDLSYKMPAPGGEDILGVYEVIGRSNPKFFGGYTNVFNYGRFNLTSLFTFSYGGKLMYQKDVSDMNMASIANVGIRILDRYNADNTGSERPRLMYNQDTYLSDKNVFNSSYLKLKSLSLGYSLPSTILQKLKVNSLNVFATGMNLFTVTKYPGPDPEVSDNPTSVIGGGRDISSYPTVRSFTFGLRLGF
jgi:TonB-linked SusC/RagA family outer membrane protein